MIGSTIEYQDNYEYGAYWLSNASSLLFILDMSIKSDGTSSVRKHPPPTSLFERMTMGFRSSPSTVNPALVFKLQLIAYVEKMYGIIRNNLEERVIIISLPSLLLRRECCTFSNGEYVKAGLAQLKLWCGQAKKEYAGSAWDELQHIRQAVGFLVIHKKSRISYDKISKIYVPF